MRLLLIALRNLRRNRMRSLLTVFGAAVAIVAFIMLRTVLAAWSAAADHAAKDRLATRHKVSFVIPMPLRYVEEIRQVPGIKQATYMNWFGGKNPKKPEEFFATLAGDAESMLEVYDEVVVSPEDRARWLADKQGALVGDVLARQLGVKVGDKLTLEGSIYPGDWEFHVSGIYTASRKSIDRSTLFFHWRYLNDAAPEAMRDQIGWVATRIDDPTRGPDIATAIDRLFDDRDVQTATMSERAMNLSFMGMFVSMLKALDVISVIILVIMMMILGNTIAMGVRERTREYGVLRAMGFSPRQIGVFVVAEAGALGLLAGLVGLGLSVPIVELGLGRFLEENMGAWFPYFRIPAEIHVAGLALAVALALVASALPARAAARLQVTEALRRIA